MSDAGSSARRFVRILLGAFFILGYGLCGPPAAADIIEVKDEGFMDGEILSEGEDEIQFKDKRGRTRAIPRSRLTYLQKEDKAQSVKQLPANLAYQVKRIHEKVRGKAEELTQSVYGSASAPVNRSAANAKSDMLSSALDEAGKAAAAMNQRQLAVMREQKAALGDWGLDGAGAEEKKGRFTSLED